MYLLESQEEAMDIGEKEDWSMFSPEHMRQLIRDMPEPSLGYLVWTRQSHGEKMVYECINALKARRISHLRTGLSWAEWIHKEQREWIVWYIRTYAKELHVLPCLTFTPPEYGVKWSVNAPPVDETLYGTFVEEVLHELGDCFDTVELWNEWNIETDWDDTLDPGFEKFISMIKHGASVAHEFNKRVLLGGQSKVNERSVGIAQLFIDAGLDKAIDVPGFHNLRGTWSDHVPSPSLSAQAKLLQDMWGSVERPWLTEYGFPIADPEKRFDLSKFESMQVALFAYAVYSCLKGGIGRAYWYTYKDEVHESLRFATTGWEDVLQFYFGDTDENANPRLLAKLLVEGGPTHVLMYAAKEGLMSLVDEASLGRKLPA